MHMVVLEVISQVNPLFFPSQVGVFIYPLTWFSMHAHPRLTLCLYAGEICIWWPGGYHLGQPADAPDFADRKWLQSLF